MRTSFPLIALGLLPTFLTGCVFFPHAELMAPPAQGRVLDSDTLEPVPKAKVVRRIERLDRDRVTFTDSNGAFTFKKDNDLGWLLMVDYAANQIHYRIDSIGYRVFQTNLYGGGSFYRGRLPHDLGVVLLQRQSETIEPDGAANGSQPIRLETNRTSSAAGSRR